MLSLLGVAVALGLSNFAAAIGIGLAGVDTTTRWRVGVVFGVFEAVMPLVGLLAGRELAGSLGGASRAVGAALLVATGLVTVWRARRAPRAARTTAGLPTGSLLTAGLALSLDNLLVGVALGTRDVSVVAAVAVIATVSVTLSLAGLELGARLGAATEYRSDVAAGVVLVVVGVAIAVGVL